MENSRWRILALELRAVKLSIRVLVFRPPHTDRTASRTRREMKGLANDSGVGDWLRVRRSNWRLDIANGPDGLWITFGNLVP